MTWLLVTWCPLVALLWRFWASFPGFHIALFHYQVIGNCGVISLMRCSNGPVKTRMPPASKIKLRIVFCYQGMGFSGDPHPQLLVGGVVNMTLSSRWPLARLLDTARGS